MLFPSESLFVCSVGLMKLHVYDYTVGPWKRKNKKLLCVPPNQTGVLSNINVRNKQTKNKKQTNLWPSHGVLTFKLNEVVVFPVSVN